MVIHIDNNNSFVMLKMYTFYTSRYMYIVYIIKKIH